MDASIERYVKKKSYCFWVIIFIEFAGTREVLKAKQKALKSLGKGCRNKPNASHSLTDSEVDELYRKGQLGSGTPEAMLNNTTRFGMRGGIENRDLCWGDIQLKEDISDGEAIPYLELTRNGKQRHVRAKTLVISIVSSQECMKARKDAPFNFTNICPKEARRLQ